VIIIAILMLIPLGFGFINSILYIEPTVNKDLSGNQISEICTKLKFEIKPDESIFIEYWPTVLQATTYLKVTIANVESEENFLSRFYGVVGAIEPYQGYDREAYFSAYNVEVFQLDRIPKDYSCTLYFADEGESLRAMFHISGYIPELKKIYNFSKTPYRPLFVNSMFMIPFIIEVVLIILLVVQVPIWFLHKRNHFAN